MTNKQKKKFFFNKSHKSIECSILSVAYYRDTFSYNAVNFLFSQLIFIEVRYRIMFDKEKVLTLERPGPCIPHFCPLSSEHVKLADQT